MARTASKITQDIATQVVSAGVGITVSPTSTTTKLYALLRPLAQAIERAESDSYLLRSALSWLAASGKHLDNLAKENNVVRVENETDESLRANAPRIFVPEDTPATVIDKELNDYLDTQIDDVRDVPFSFFYRLAETKAAALLGAKSDLPFLGPRLFSAVSRRIRELYAILASIIHDYQPEHADYLADTDWIYRFAAMRIPGVLDAKVFLERYNRTVILLHMDERPWQDGEHRYVRPNVSEIKKAVHHSAGKYLPPESKIPGPKPQLEVRLATERDFYVQAVYSGTATKEAVAAGAIDYVYANRQIGENLASYDIAQAMLAVPGVTWVSMSQPSDSQLLVGPNELLQLGAVIL